MNDSTSAEAYCTLGGEVVPAKTAQQIGDRSDLQPWAALVTPFAAPGKQPKSAPGPLKRQKTVDEEVKKDLVMILLEVYMSGGYVPGRCSCVRGTDRTSIVQGDHSRSYCTVAQLAGYEPRRRRRTSASSTVLGHTLTKPLTHI